MNRSKRLNTLRHLKVAFSEQVHLVQQTIFFFLLLDVLPNGSFIPTYRRNIVASCPELLTAEVSPSGHGIPGDVRLHSSPSPTPPRPKRHTLGGWKPAYAHDPASDGLPPPDSLVDAPALEVSLPDTGEAAHTALSSNISESIPDDTCTLRPYGVYSECCSRQPLLFVTFARFTWGGCRILQQMSNSSGPPEKPGAYRG